jgi:hypothetical protein
MSTRCNIHFTDGHSKTVQANIYRHSDGYPEAVLPDLEKFFGAVEDQTSDTRFGDPEYLAAKFVVWEATKDYEYRSGARLDFLGVGVVTQDAGDAAYIYTVKCAGPGRPQVTHKHA